MRATRLALVAILVIGCVGIPAGTPTTTQPSMPSLPPGSGDVPTAAENTTQPSSTSAPGVSAPPTPVTTPAPADSAPPSSAVPSAATPAPSDTETPFVPSPAPPPPPQLTWREIGELGPGLKHRDDEEIFAFVGFDSGYIAAERIVGGEGQWATRLWFSADGRDWQVVEAWDQEEDVRAMATNGPEVVMLFETLEYTAAAWVSSDGINWQTADSIAGDSDFDSPVARSVWTRPGGWYAAMYEPYEGCGSPYGCYRGSLWTSDSGLSWERLGIIDEGDPTGGATAADGTILVHSDFLMSSSDGGQTWKRVRLPRNCYDSYQPRFIASSAATDNMLIYGGGRNICSAEPNLHDWSRLRLPTSSRLDPYRTNFVDTRFGILASAPRDCYESPAGCPPLVEQFQSADGTVWSALDGPTSDLQDDLYMAFSDGPGGVIGLVTHSSGGTTAIKVFELVEKS